VQCVDSWDMAAAKLRARRKQRYCPEVHCAREHHHPQHRVRGQSYAVRQRSVTVLAGMAEPMLCSALPRLRYQATIVIDADSRHFPVVRELPDVLAIHEAGTHV
jgi:hypothetical protein